MSFSNNLNPPPPCDLENGVKVNKILSVLVPQQYSCTSLVKTHPFILEMGCRIRSRSPKSNQFFFMSQQYSCASLVKIHPFLHEIGCRQAIFQQSKPLCDLENGIKVTNLISSISCQQYSCASLVKIHPFLHEIGCRQAIFQQSEPSCDLENGVKVTKI